MNALRSFISTLVDGLMEASLWLLLAIACLLGLAFAIPYLGLVLLAVVAVCAIAAVLFALALIVYGVTAMVEELLS